MKERFITFEVRHNPYYVHSYFILKDKPGAGFASKHGLCRNSLAPAFLLTSKSCDK